MLTIPAALGIPIAALGGPAAVIAAHGRQPGRMTGEEHHPGVGLARGIRALPRMLAGQVRLAASVLGYFSRWCTLAGPRWCQGSTASPWPMTSVPGNACGPWPYWAVCAVQPSAEAAATRVRTDW